jgi:CDP-glucose 4,6-dehydratase
MQLVRGELTDSALLTGLLSAHAPEYVFHLAAQSQVRAARSEPAATFEINVRGTWLVLEAARRAARPPKVILASSTAVYGDAGQQPHEEDEPLSVRLPPYAASKVCMELVGQSYHRGSGLGVCAARCSNLYGGGDPNRERLVPSAVNAALRGEAPTVASDGRARRDYLYVEDAVRGYLALAEKMAQPGVAGQVFNLCSGRTFSTLDVVETVLRVAGRPDLSPRVLGESRDEAAEVRLSAAKARHHLGWAARVPLEEGLRTTIGWYEMASAAAEMADRS